jgi:nucleoside-diphosphate-sugar epimerase
MGKTFEDVTLDVNRHAAVAMARAARQAGVRRFVFASSCSVYGAAEEGARTETSAVNPLTAYARSKVYAEEDLQALAQDSFVVTALRFATACGMSERLRLDLVVNDFVAAAVASGQITILSDGTPWRPLIHVKDMARAIDWAVARPATPGGSFLSVNVGREDWNHQVRDLAAAVAKVIPGTTVSINTDAQPDKRSYRVDFSLFRQLAPDHQPVYDLTATVREMHTALVDMQFNDVDFRNSRLVRLHALNHLVESGALTPDLRWKPQPLKLPTAT